MHTLNLTTTNGDPSIDRLGGIILNEFFPFHQYWSYFPKQVATLNAAAHQLWQEGNISSCGPDQYRVIDSQAEYAPALAIEYSICDEF
jgi:hypothetical protein